MATIRVAEAGIPVELFSIVPVKRSHSVCAQGGINAAKIKRAKATLSINILTTRFMAAIFWRISRW